MLVSTEPTASSTACGTKFSEAIISSVHCWRRSSRSSTCGDLRIDLGQGGVLEVVGQLGHADPARRLRSGRDAALVATALELGEQEALDDRRASALLEAPSAGRARWRRCGGGSSRPPRGHGVTARPRHWRHRDARRSPVPALLCPDLRRRAARRWPTSSGAVTTATAAATLLHATSDIRSRGRGPMELRGLRYKRNWMRANQAIYRVGGGVEVFRTDAKLHFYSVGAYWGRLLSGRSTPLSMEIWSARGDGGHWSGSGPGRRSSTASATSSTPSR